MANKKKQNIALSKTVYLQHVCTLQYQIDGSKL